MMIEAQTLNQAAPTASLPRFLILYAILYASFGVASPFLPAFIETRGIPAEQIGLIFGAATATPLLSAPVAGRFADRYGMRRNILAICAVAAAMAALLYLPASGFSFVLAVALFQALALAPLTPLADALALLSANPRNAPRPAFEYGWVRGVGSAAFILGSIMVGYMIPWSGLGIILWLQTILLTAVAFAVWLVPDHKSKPSGPDVGPLTSESLRVLLGIAAFRRVVLAAVLILGSHAMHDTFAVIRWRAADISPETASLLWSAAVAAEVVVFFTIGPWLVRVLTPAGAIALAALAGALRWGIAAETADVTALLFTQPLHGFTFGLLHLACMRLLAKNVPSQFAATAQAIYCVVGIGAATALVTLLSGWLYGRMGPAAFAIMSVMCLAALPMAAGLRRV